MRTSSLGAVALLLALSANANAYCSKPSPPMDMSGYGSYADAMDNYISCLHRENVLSAIERGASMSQVNAAREQHEGMKEQLYAEVESVRRRLQSGSQVQGGNASSSIFGPTSSTVQGSNCSEMQRDATQRMQQIQQRLQNSNSLCESYRLGQQLGEIGVQMYRRCPILDPGGTQLAAAEQMVRDGRRGQAQACTQ
jgi:hypothetical protein